jgi:hypothetical protein
MKATLKAGVISPTEAILHAAREYDASSLSGETRYALKRTKFALNASADPPMMKGITVRELDAELAGLSLTSQQRFQVKLDLMSAGILRAVA